MITLKNLNRARPLRCAALAVAALALSACGEEPPPVAEQIRAIKTITVADRGNGQVRRFPGLVEAVDTSAIAFEVAGNTREVKVNVGDRVTSGQVLATLDETPFKLNVESAKAELGKAKASLAEKQNEYDRQKTLYSKDWVSKAAYDQAVAGRDSRKSQVAFAVSKLNLARRDLEKTILVAPFDGVIANKFVEPFQEVARGEKVFEVYAEGAMEVVISVPETVIGKIHLGLPADVSFPAESIDDLKGRISEIGRVATEANAFPVKVALTDPPAKVLPGMTAEASLLLGDQGDAASYLVPLTAIIPGEQPKHGYVFVYDPETATVRKNEVRGGGVRDDRILIAEGLEAGQIVAVAGVSFLRDGQKVKLLAQ